MVTASRDVVDALPAALRWLLDSFEFVLLVLSVSGLYFYVPYTRVRWRHALTAGLLVALGIELAKKLLAVYLTQIPTYSAIYGAFAALPILLVWIYVAWVIVLLGAVVAATLPELGRQTWRKAEGLGWTFKVALELLAALQAVRGQEERGLSLTRLSLQLQVEPGVLSELLAHLQALDWVGALRDEGGTADARHVLLIEPKDTLLAPLVERLLLSHGPEVEPLWLAVRLDQARMSEALPRA